MLFAELTNDTNLQLQGLLDVLKSVQDCLKLAHRGGATPGMTSVGCFHRARSMLALVVYQVEVMTDNAGAYLDDFCNEQAGDSTV